VQSAQHIGYFEQEYDFDNNKDEDNDEDEDTAMPAVEKFTSMRLAQFKKANAQIVDEVISFMKSFGFVSFLIVGR
jgi:hypothetical protein